MKWVERIKCRKRRQQTNVSLPISSDVVCGFSRDTLISSPPSARSAVVGCGIRKTFEPHAAQRARWRSPLVCMTRPKEMSPLEEEEGCPLRRLHFSYQHRQTTHSLIQRGDREESERDNYCSLYFPPMIECDCVSQSVIVLFARSRGTRDPSAYSLFTLDIHFPTLHNVIRIIQRYSHHH